MRAMSRVAPPRESSDWSASSPIRRRPSSSLVRKNSASIQAIGKPVWASTSRSMTSSERSEACREAYQPRNLTSPS
jgi:hypothetical protein